MKEYNILNNYLIFQKLHINSIGINYRAGEIEGKKAKNHKILTEVHPFFYKNENIWKRIKILLQGINKSKISNLYSPEKIIEDKDKAMLIFPHLSGNYFEKIVEDAEKKNIPINFDLAFSIIISIADLIETGSSIVISGEKSFHGFLTPDNIIIDYDGNIYLKNYGIFPHIQKQDDIFKEMEMKYGSWLTPEFIRKEKLSPQSDIYHLGYILYRILTGHYFSYSSKENFETKFSNISFNIEIPSTEIDFLTKIINFFKKTLDPNPSNRFSNITEFKNYISDFFKIEELSSVAFNLSYFMNSIYSEEIEKEEEILKKELSYTIQEKKEKKEKREEKEEKIKPLKKDSELVESILSGLDEKEKSKSKLPYIIIGIIAIAIIAVVIYLNNKKVQTRLIDIETKTKQETLLKQKADKQKEIENQKVREAEEQKRLELTRQLEELQSKVKKTEEEKQRLASKQKELKQLEEKKNKEYKDFFNLAKTNYDNNEFEKALENIKSAREINDTDDLNALEEQVKIEKAESIEKEKIKKDEEIQKKKEEKIANMIKKGQPIPLESVTQKPVKKEAPEPVFPKAIQKKYKGQTITVDSNILINENGNIDQVKILGKVPTDLKLTISSTLASWKYKPAKWNKKNVKVRVKVTNKISF
jgi:hypothetical protein